jgi:hypothetical protein
VCAHKEGQAHLVVGCEEGYRGLSDHGRLAGQKSLVNSWIGIREGWVHSTREWWVVRSPAGWPTDKRREISTEGERGGRREEEDACAALHIGAHVKDEGRNVCHLVFETKNVVNLDHNVTRFRPYHLPLNVSCYQTWEF